jgi:hypothetical protein
MQCGDVVLLDIWHALRAERWSNDLRYHCRVVADRDRALVDLGIFGKIAIAQLSHSGDR